MKRLRRYAHGIAGFRRWGSANWLVISRLPNKLLTDPEWRERHLIAPQTRHLLRQLDTPLGAL